MHLLEAQTQAIQNYWKSYILHFTGPKMLFFTGLWKKTTPPLKSTQIFKFYWNRGWQAWQSQKSLWCMWSKWMCSSGWISNGSLVRWSIGLVSSFSCQYSLEWNSSYCRMHALHMSCKGTPSNALPFSHKLLNVYLSRLSISERKATNWWSCILFFPCSYLVIDFALYSGKMQCLTMLKLGIAAN